MKIGDFISTLAANSGIANDDALLKAFVDNKQLSDVELPDSITMKIQGNYMTLDAAKNHPTVLAHVKAQLYNGVDKTLEGAFGELQLEDATIQELLQEKSTTLRIKKALLKVSELEKAKAGANKGDKAVLQLEIDKLNGNIKTLTTDYDKKLSDLSSKHESDLMDYDLKTILAQYNYSLPKEMPADLKIATAKMAVNSALQAKDGKLVRENGSMKLKRASQDSDFYDEKNTKLDYKAFIDSVLSQNNLLNVNGNGGTTATAANVQTTTITNDKQTRGLSNINNAIDMAIADFDKGSQVQQ